MRRPSAGLLTGALAVLALGCGSGGSDSQGTSVAIPPVTQPTLTQARTPSAKPGPQGQTSTGSVTTSPSEAGAGEGQTSIDSCPAGMSKPMCRELILALKQGRTSSSEGRSICTPPLSKDQCEEIMRRLGRHP